MTFHNQQAQSSLALKVTCFGEWSQKKIKWAKYDSGHQEHNYWHKIFPSLPKSSKYLLMRSLDLLKAFSVGVWSPKHLLTRCLED